MKTRTRRAVLSSIIGGVMLTLGLNVVAKTDYPKRPIKLLLPIAPGGDTDVNARVFGKYLEKKLGKSIVVVNVDGAGGTIGMRQVKQSKPDGYTVMFFHTEAMVPKLAGISDIGLEDFKIVAIGIIDNTTILVTRKDRPYDDMKSLDDYVKDHPNEVDFGTMIGGYPHLIGVAINNELSEPLNLVDTGGNAAKLTALRGNKTDVINTQYMLVKDELASGEFVNLGLLSEERNPLIPDVRTTKEQNYDLEFNKFFFFAMPKETPDEIVDIFSEAVKDVVEDEEYKEEAEKYYLSPKYMNPEEATKYIENAHEKLQKYSKFLRPESN